MPPCGSDDGVSGVSSLLGRSGGMARLRDRIAVVAAAPVPVLIRGEAGTGKGLIARCLHAASGPADRPFIAVEGRHAQVEEAVAALGGGRAQGEAPATLYLKDVEGLGPEQQHALCRVLAQEDGPRAGTVRIFASTTADLGASSARDAFLPDLLFALAVGTLRSLPLRDIAEDVPVLMEHFVAREAARYGRPVPALDAHLPHLLAHGWPGNVPELRTFAVRLVLGLEDEAPGVSRAGRTLADQVGWFERQVIAHHLDRCGGDVQAACAGLAVSRTTLYEKLNRYGLRVERAKREAVPRGPRLAYAAKRRVA